MDVRETLLCLFSLAVFTLSAAQHDAFQNCASQEPLFDRLSADVKMAVDSGERPPNAWSSEQKTELLLYMRNLSDTLHQHQLTECHGAEPKRCPEAEVPENGGLVCLTLANRRFCKPMCNHGYDFGFLRRSRPFDECSEQTSYKWNSQYVGGNKLAVCNKASIQISGASTAYFAKDCLTAKSNRQQTDMMAEVLITELKSAGIEGEMDSVCSACG